MGNAFQRPVAPETIEAMCRRAFGDGIRIDQVGEIGVGTYNSTYRVDIDGREPVILRVAPAVADRAAMRDEYAAAPFFAALGPLVPRILFADFTHQITDRDYMIQALLPGVPADTGLEAFADHTPYYRHLGAITRTIHDVRGDHFGPIAGPGFATWSEAVADQFRTLAAAYDRAGIDAGDVRRTLAAVDAHRDALDEITEPRLLHGDLWRLNILIGAEMPEPTITGVLDYDSASWGDPLADWTIHQVRQRPYTAAFWDTYGPAPAHPVRHLFYQARSVAGARFDIHRRGIDLRTVPPIHWDLTKILADLGA